MWPQYPLNPGERRLTNNIISQTEATSYVQLSIANLHKHTGVWCLEYEGVSIYPHMKNITEGLIINNIPMGNVWKQCGS